MLSAVVGDPAPPRGRSGTSDADQLGLMDGIPIIIPGGLATVLALHDPGPLGGTPPPHPREIQAAQGAPAGALGAEEQGRSLNGRRYAFL